jgi:hypothetical protein
VIPFEQKEPDYLLWGPLRSSFASSSTPAGCLLQLKHGLDEGAGGARREMALKTSITHQALSINRLLFLNGRSALGI